MAPTFTAVASTGATTSIAGGVLIPPTDARFSYRAAGGYAFGVGFPLTTLFAASNRYDNSWGTPPVDSVEWNHTGLEFEILLYASNITVAALQIKIDGQRSSALPILFSSLGATAGGRFKYKITFPTSATRKITYEGSYGPFGGVFVDGSNTISACTPELVRMIFQGDSITGSSNENTGAPIGSYCFKLANYLQVDPWNVAIGGTGYVNAGTSVILDDRLADTANWAPNVVQIWAGYNDNLLSQVTISTNANQYYADTKAALPTAEIYVIGCYSTTAPPGASLTNTDNTLKAAALANGLPFASPQTGDVYNAAGTLLNNVGPLWVDAAAVAAYVGSDGTHPNDAGHARIATWLRSVYQAFTSPVAQKVGTVTGAFQLDGTAAGAFTASGAAMGDASFAGATTGIAPSGGGGVPVLQGTATLVENAASTTIAVTVPTGVAAGELLICAVTGSRTASGDTLTPPAGWNTAALVKDGSTNGVVTGLYWRVATGGESSTYTWTCTAGTAGRIGGAMQRVSGVDSTTPMDVAAASASLTAVAGTTIDSPTITTVTANALLVGVGSVNASASATLTPPGSMAQINTTTGVGRRQTWATEAKAVAGATGTRTWTSSTTGLQRAAIIAALRPSSSTPVTPTLTSRIVGATRKVSVRTSDAVSVRLKVGTNTAVTAGVTYTTAQTPDSQGGTVHDVSALAAGIYYYRVAMTDTGSAETVDVAGTVGRFIVPPSTATNFNVLFGSCTNSTDHAVFATMAARGDDLFLHLGDLWYADGSGQSVANYRTKMTQQVQSVNHQALLAVTPSDYIPSDHDFGMLNDANGTLNPAALAPFNQVYREVWPNTPDPATTGVYHSFSWGRVRFIMLDTVTFKSDPAATDNSSKSMLGATQKQWVKDTATAATEPVLILCSDVPWSGQTTAGAADWGGFNTERQELATYLNATGKKSVFLSGDMHAVAASSGTTYAQGIPNYAAAPFNNNASIKGGPWDAVYPTSGSAVVSQYGRISVTDSGTQIVLAFTGYSQDGTARVTRTDTFTTAKTGTATGAFQFDGSAAGTHIQLVQQVTGTGAATSVPVTVPATTAGNALVLVIANGSGLTNPVSGVTDTAGNAWALGSAGFQSGSNTRIEIWYALNAASTTQVTVTKGSAAVCAIGITEWAGVAQVGALDQAAGAGSATATSHTAGPVTTTFANELLIGGISFTGAAVSTLTTPGFTALTDLSNTQRGRAAYAIVSATGTYSVNWTLSAAANAGNAMVGLKSAAVSTGAGAATGAFQFDGAVAGAADLSGAASGAATWDGLASGAITTAGTAAGQVTWAGTSAGSTVMSGAATGAFTFVGAAVGSSGSGGSASGAVAWAGAASGATTLQGSVTGAVAWLGSGSCVPGVRRYSGWSVYRGRSGGRSRLLAGVRYRRHELGWWCRRAGPAPWGQPGNRFGFAQLGRIRLPAPAPLRGLVLELSPGSGRRQVRPRCPALLPGQ